MNDKRAKENIYENSQTFYQRWKTKNLATKQANFQLIKMYTIFHRNS